MANEQQIDNLVSLIDGYVEKDGHHLNVNVFNRETLLDAGILLINTFPQLLLAGIILFAMTTLFSFITLPVEINASKRALVWLSSSGITNSYNHSQAEDALRSAAYTYVVAALGSLATLIYYVMIFMGRRD